MTHPMDSLGAGGGPANSFHQDYLGAGSAPGYGPLDPRDDPGPDHYFPPVKEPAPDHLGKFARGMVSVFSYLISGPSACTPRYDTGLVYSSTKNPDLRFRVELSGNPSVGTVYYLRQVHWANPILATKPTTMEEARLISEQQKKILNTLEALEIRDVFLEGLVQNFPAGTPREEIRNFMEASFPEPLKEYLTQGESPEELEGRAVVALAFLGAGFLYALQHPEVSLYRTVTLEEARQHNDILMELKRIYGEDSDSLIKDPRYEHTGFRERERIAVGEVMAFLGENPGADLVLIYGTAHQFCDDFSQLENPPKLVSIWWRAANGSEIVIPDSCE